VDSDRGLFFTGQPSFRRDPIGEVACCNVAIKHIMAKLSENPNQFTGWKPQIGWLFLLPSRTSDKQGEIILPESHTKKSNQGICFDAQVPFGQESDFLDKECLFPDHIEYRVEDTETGYEIYIVPAEKVIMTRIPNAETLAISRAKGSGASLKFHTIEASRKAS